MVYAWRSSKCVVHEPIADQATKIEIKNQDQTSYRKNQDRDQDHIKIKTADHITSR
jgi:hypothetical protein